MLLLVLFGFITILTLIYYLLSNKNNYWKKRGVPYPKPSLILGNYGDFILMKKHQGSVVNEICKQFPDSPFVGALYGTEPVFIVKDPELMKTVTTKDFHYFSGRELSEHTQKESFTKNVFHEQGDYWRVIRQNLTPLFSSAKMKKMFHLIQNCTVVFEKLLDEEIQKKKVHEIRTLMGRFTMDCIGSCAFGLNTQVMETDLNNNPFKMIADKIFDFSAKRTMSGIIRGIWPSIFYGLGFKAFPEEINTFFKKLLVGVFEERKYKPTARNDFVDLVLTFKENKCIVGDKGKLSIEVDDDLLAAQCMIFFAAGFETSATTMSFTLYELAKHEEAQRRAIEEVNEYVRRHEGKVDYDCVTELPFVEACIDETLRLYPVLSVIPREVVENYTLPNGLRLEKGMRVQLPACYFHHNPKYFPEPEEYRPERFLPENKDKITPYTYFPFGEGPRICIGMRFAKMQMLAGFVTILKKYRVELADDMPRSVELEPKSLVTQSKGGINLKFIPRKTVFTQG